MCVCVLAVDKEKSSQLPHGTRHEINATSASHKHDLDVKRRCSWPPEQSRSCFQHNMNGDIFKGENMRMTSLPLKVPVEAS